MEVFRFPLAKAFLFFLAGILLAPHVTIPDSWSGAAAVALMGAGLLFSRKKTVSTVFFYLACAGTGTAAATAEKWTSQPSHYLNFTHTGAEPLMIELRERLKPSPTRERFVANVEKTGRFQTSGKLLLRLPRGRVLPIGSRLGVVARISRNAPSGNPDQFEYGCYLDDHDIPAQANASIFRVVGQKRDFYYFADRLRHRIIENLRRQRFSETSIQLLSALVLGARQDISPEVTGNFQAAGAVHILAVSGLHIGFVVLLLQFLLKPLPRTPGWRLIRLLSMVATLWLFAGISGFSPSVVRAATMFSVIAVGRHIGRDAGTMHAVFVSAFLLLAIRPSFVYDVGFQLSYAAVVSILLFEPGFRKWRPENKLSRYLYDIISVSLAAQLGTMPLTLLYFHQFPGLFLLTNLLVLPLLSAIMFLGMAAAGLAAFGFGLTVISLPLEKLLECLGLITAKIGSVDALVIRDIPMDVPLALLTSAAVVAFVPVLKKPNYRNIARMALAVIAVQSYNIADSWKNARDERLLVFRQSKTTLIAVRKSGDLNVFGEPTDRNLSAISSYSVANRLHTVWQKPASLLYADGKKVLVWSGASIPDMPSADIVIFRQSPKLNLERFIAAVKPTCIVADCSNYKTAVQLWERTCRKQKIPFHNVYEKGCFVSREPVRIFSAR